MASGNAIESWLTRAVTSEWEPLRRIMPDSIEYDDGHDIPLPSWRRHLASGEVAPDHARVLNYRTDS